MCLGQADSVVSPILTTKVEELLLPCGILWEWKFKHQDWKMLEIKLRSSGVPSVCTDSGLGGCTRHRCFANSRVGTCAEKGREDEMTRQHSPRFTAMCDTKLWCYW